MTELAQVYGIDVPRSRCEVCGHKFVTAGDETVCDDCKEDPPPPPKKPNPFDAFLSRCVSDCVNARSETTEPDHTHRCPVCGDSWIHADLDCEVVRPNQTWARCPIHEGRDE